MEAVTRKAGRGARPRPRGFTLIELLVVVIIVGILAALAVPSMSLTSFERDTYNDAGAIMQLFRSARTRAIGRGSAVLVGITGSSTDRGRVKLYEATTINPNAAAGAQTPVSTCKYPTTWPVATLTPFDGVDLNGQIESLAGITAQPYQYNPTATAFSEGYVCYTPLGRSYFFAGAAPPSFSGLATVNPIEIQVTHYDGATIRSVLVPPNGMARLFSHTQ